MNKSALYSVYSKVVMRTFIPLAAILLCATLRAETTPPTFHKDIEPLLQDRCQSCHHPGDIAPMSLLTYQDARKWSKAIKQNVALRKMPPWYADPSAHQQYQNDKSLSAAEIQLIRSWVDAGSPEGNPQDAPPARDFPDGWNIGKPDFIVQMSKPYAIPASGTIEYTYIIIPTNFKHDVWVRAAEIRPSTRAVMHHSILFIRTPGSKWLAEYPKNQPFVPKPRPGTDGRSSDGDRTEEGSLADEWLATYVPGQRPFLLPEDTGFLIKAGSDFVLQIHYTANGKATEDLTRIGLVFSRGLPAKRAFTSTIARGDFAIPPGDPNYKMNASATLATPVRLLSAAPHMHLRGKAMSLQAVYPSRQPKSSSTCRITASTGSRCMSSKRLSSCPPEHALKPPPLGTTPPTIPSTPTPKKRSIGATKAGTK